MTKTIHPVDSKAEAYLALPKRHPAPGVLLLHAWWGLNDFMRGLADRLAGEGYAVLAPDYLGGGTAGTLDEAKQLRSRLDRKAANRLIQDAAGPFLADSAVEEPIGVIGISLGCGFALELARRLSDRVAAVVLFYGTGGGKFDRVRAAIQGHFAEDDRWGANAKKVESFEDRLKKAGVAHEFHCYPGTTHWFFEEDRLDAYHPKAATVAWNQTLGFLRMHL